MKSVRNTLFLWLILCLSSLAQDCDCPKGLEHLCRCNVLIEEDMARRQLAYLNRLLMAEFKELIVESPISSVRLGTRSQMMLQGEAAQGYIDGDEIVINHSLRRDKALMVIAHELGHAWHFSSRPDEDDIDDFLVEGFAEWVAFHLVKRAGLTEFSHQIKTNPDPLYGKAFRWFYELESKHGRGAVLNIMLNWVDVEGHRS